MPGGTVNVVGSEYPPSPATTFLHASLPNPYTPVTAGSLVASRSERPVLRLSNRRHRRDRSSTERRQCARSPWPPASLSVTAWRGADMPGSRTLLRPATGNALAGSATTFRGLSACRSLARWMMPGWHPSACPGSPGSPGIRSAADHPGDVLEFLPQRPPRQVAGGSLQCPLVPRRRQPRPADMVRQHEASVVDPLGRRLRSQRERRVRGTLPEPAKP
jgi:hypothetical protein